MERKMRIMIMAIVLVLCMAVSVFAADTVKGKVVNVTGNKITIVLESSVPPWIKAGTTVISGNAAPRILKVKGNEVVLRFSKAKASKIKVDSTMLLEESTDQGVQGC